MVNSHRSFNSKISIDAFAPTKLHSICLTENGLFCAIRRQDSSRLHPQSFKDMRRVRSKAGPSIKFAPGFGQKAWLQFDLREAPRRATAMVMWDNGRPRMYGLLLPKVDLSLDSSVLDWLVSKYDLQPNIFERAARQLRNAPAGLPCLITVFTSSIANSLTRMERDWELSEAVALTVLRLRRDREHVGSRIICRQRRSETGAMMQDSLRPPLRWSLQHRFDRFSERTQED